jgi:tetratricopeptide (TPR) repeat protein
MRTGLILILFTALATAQEHHKARQLMAEAGATTNPIRLLVLSFQIREALEAALARDPDNLEVRLDLVRFHTMTPAIAGGDSDDAELQIAEIASRDAALGAFARGYAAYREKQYGPARRELREARRLAKAPATKLLATKWLGWLSQETQQWEEAFAMFDELRASDPAGLYEIGRTAAFCACELERGRAALEKYLTLPPGRELPSGAMARYQLALVHEKRGDAGAARREANAAWRLDRKVTGLKELRGRLNLSGR